MGNKLFFILVVVAVYALIVYLFIRSTNKTNKQYQEMWEKDFNDTLKLINKNFDSKKYKFIIKKNNGYQLSLIKIDNKAQDFTWDSSIRHSRKRFSDFIWGVNIGMCLYKALFKYK